MPYKSEKIKLPPEYDRRRKLSDKQKDEIRYKYSLGFHSLNDLAKEYGVSKKTVLLTVNPESKRKNDQRMKDHWRDYVPTNKEWAKTIREYRRRKQRLYTQGKLTEDCDDSKSERKK